MPIAPEDEPFAAPARRASPDGTRVGVLLMPRLHRHARLDAAVGGVTSTSRATPCRSRCCPGHGTRGRSSTRTTYADWYAEARAGLREAAGRLRPGVRRRAVHGRLPRPRPGRSRRGRDVAGIVAGEPRRSRRDRKDVQLLPVLKRVVPSFPGIGNDIKKPGVDERGLPRARRCGAPTRCSRRCGPSAGPPARGHPAAADVPLRGRPRRRPLVRRGVILTRSRPATSRSGCSRTATTWPPSTTTPRDLRGAPPSSSRRVVPARRPLPPAPAMTPTAPNRPRPRTPTTGSTSTRRSPRSSRTGSPRRRGDRA